ncbi:MAG: DMT family transporter [Fervidicoccaceae archaeon]|jgi:drug/metabolite transporter (DMT)-like permease
MQGESWKYAAIYILLSIPLNFLSKDILSVSGPFFLTVVRSAIIAAFLMLMMRRVPKIEPFHILMASLIYVSTVLWLFSLIFLTPGDSIVLGYSMPMIAVILGRFILGEKGRIWISLISLSGFVVYSVPISSAGSFAGAFISFLNAFFWALYSVLYRKRINADPIETNAAIFLIMTLISIPFTFLEKPPSTEMLQPRYLFDLFWLSIAGGALQFVSWNKLLLLEGIEKATLESYLVPIGVLSTQIFIYGNAPNSLQILGLGIALFGVFLPEILGRVSSPSLWRKKA